MVPKMDDGKLLAYERTRVRRHVETVFADNRCYCVRLRSSPLTTACESASVLIFGLSRSSTSTLFSRLVADVAERYGLKAPVKQSLLDQDPSSERYKTMVLRYKSSQKPP